MVKIYYNLLLAVVVLLMTSASSYAENNTDIVDAYGYSSIKFSILNSLGHERPPNDASGLLVFLGSIDDSSARKLLVDLTSYYLGSATGEALHYSIVRQGKEILPELMRALDEPITCTGKVVSPPEKCLSLEERDRLIRKLINLIDSGKKLDYVM